MDISERNPDLARILSSSFLVCSRQRSGTYALSQTLQNNGITIYFEPFLISWKQGCSFSTFLDENKISALRLISGPEEILWEYLIWLTSLNNCSRFLMDVKYNQLHLFNGVAYAEGSRPSLLRYMQAYGVKTLHLMRKNLFAQFMSRQMQIRTKQHHLAAGHEQQTAEPFFVNINEFRSYIISSEASIKKFQAWNRLNKKYYEVFYEDVFDDAGLTPKFCTLLKNEFELNIESRTPPIRKFRYDFRHIIQNSDELLAEFANTKYQRQILDVLGAVGI